MQENIGPSSYQMNLSAAQYRVWSTSSGDRTTRLRVSFRLELYRGQGEKAMTHGIGELDRTQVNEEARAQTLTSRQEGRQGREEYGGLRM
jgi:hypothetical protein